MRKIVTALLSLVVGIELLSAGVSLFAHTAYRYLAWSEVHPLPFPGFLAIVSAVLWAVFALRWVAKGPLVMVFPHVDEHENILTVVAPVYPEDLFGSSPAAVVHKRDRSKPHAPSEPPDDATPVG